LDYLPGASPATVVANVVVHSSRGHLLAVRRSGSVDTAVGLWTIGIYETMIMEPHRPKGEREDLYTLCERGLREEVGLEIDRDYDHVMLSWFGIYGPLLRTHLVAHIKIKLPEAAVIDALEGSEGLYEADAYEWFKPNKQAVKQVLTATVDNKPMLVPSFDAVGRPWLNQTKLSLYEALRVRRAL
jgi:hypothetical protein